MADEDLYPDSGAPPYDASDPKEVEKAKDRAARREARMRTALAKFLADPGGRDWLWSKLSEANVYSQSFQVGAPDATAFNEGKRALGNSILADWVTVSPESYIGMMRMKNKGKI